MRSLKHGQAPVVAAKTHLEQRTACEFVPWYAKELTLPCASGLAACWQAGWRAANHPRLGPWGPLERPRAKPATWGLSVLRCGRMWLAALVKRMTKQARPSAPAAGSVWSSLDLAAWVSRGCRASAEGTCSTAKAAPISMGSPRDVPVPCISSVLMLPGLVLETPNAVLMTACCEGPFGACKQEPFHHHPQIIVASRMPIQSDLSVLTPCVPAQIFCVQTALRRGTEMTFHKGPRSQQACHCSLSL